ncbi:MAG TPA: hypothetical protein VFF20_03655 [Pseudogracilibacillus sp.]|nr:hypothetical protein [Pseudogracilibacillus sp.]
MSGKRIFWLSVVSGAVIGGITSLFNKEARSYSKDLVKETGETISHYAKNPDVTVQMAKDAVVSANQLVSKNTTSAMNAIEQVEDTVHKFLK